LSVCCTRAHHENSALLELIDSVT